MSGGEGGTFTLPEKWVPLTILPQFRSFWTHLLLDRTLPSDNPNRKDAYSVWPPHLRRIRCHNGTGPSRNPVRGGPQCLPVLSPVHDGKTERGRTSQHSICGTTETTGRGSPEVGGPRREDVGQGLSAVSEEKLGRLNRERGRLQKTSPDVRACYWRPKT